MTLDNAGDIIIACNKTIASGDLDYAVLKYAPNGTQHWARTYSSGPQANDRLVAIAVDSNDNVYVTGSSRTVKYNRDGQVQWVAPYPAAGLAVDSNGFVYLASFSIGANVDFATVKLAPEGTNVWLRTFDRGLADDFAQVVAVGSTGEVYVGGIVTHTCDRFECYVWFELVKYDADGNQLWFRDYDMLFAYYSSELKSLVVLDSNRIYVAGNYQGAGTKYQVTMFDGGGTNQWKFSIGGSSEGMTATVVLPSGEVYMTGSLKRGFPNTIFCRSIALNPNGTVRWLTDFGPSSGYNRFNGIAMNVIGCTYVTGQASSSFVEGTFTGATFDFLTIKYDNSGREVWQKRYNGPANGGDIAIGIAVTPDGGIFVAGQSANTNGGTDITLLKYVELENIQWLPNGTVLLQFPAPPGQSARFQASTNLITWQDIATVTPSPEGIARYTDTTVPQHPRRFYRLALP